MDAERIPVAGDGLRILLATDTVGGVWQFSLDLAARLVAGGDEVLLAAMGREPDPAQRRQADAIPGLAWCARPYRLVWMDAPGDDLDAAGRWLQGLAARFAPDVVHLNDLALAELDWPAPVLQTAHSCVCSWWRAVHGEPAPAGWDPYRERVRASLAAADMVVAPTRAMLDALVREHGAVAEARVIHNGRSAPGPATTPSAPDGKARPRKEPLVLAAGRCWDEAKNLGALAAVAPRLPWPVYVAGEGQPPCTPAGGTAVQAVDSAPIHVLGQLPEAQLRRWMTHASIYALPARYEPFGLSVVEAAQSGCALVLGDIASLREVWGEAALFVPPDDHDALEAALCRLIDDPGLREAMAQRAGMQAQRYAPDAMAAGYRDAYAGLAALRAGAGRRHPSVAVAEARA